MFPQTYVGMNQTGLDLAMELAQPTRRVTTRALNCNCPEDLGPFVEDARVGCIDLTFPDHGCLQRHLLETFSNEAMGQCMFCGSASMVQTEMTLVNSSQILVVSVNRVRIISATRAAEITDEFQVPDTLQVPTLLGRKPYKLVAAVQHSGSAGSGHYVSNLRLADGSYIKVDDAKPIVPAAENAV